MGAPRPDEVERRRETDPAGLDELRGGSCMGSEGIGSVVRSSLAQRDMAAKLAEAARWKDECIERGGGRSYAWSSR